MIFGNVGRASNGLVSRSLVAAAEGDEKARKRRMADAWARYWGQYPQSLEKTPTDPKGDDNTSVNLARRTVDISAFYLFGKPCTFTVGGEEETPADEWLAACWEANRQMTMLLEFATGASIHGDGFLRLYPAKPGEDFPRIVALDPQIVTVEWEPADFTRERRFLIEFNEVNLIAKTATAHRHRIERVSTGGWLIIEEVSHGDSKRWQSVNEEAWPYAFPPVFHCKNLPAPFSYYGRSDIEEDVLDLNGAINFVLSNINRILRVHGHPQIYATGVRQGAQLDKAIDSIWQLPSDDSKVGTVPAIENLDSHFGQLQKLRDAYHELTSIPEIATGKVENIGQLSGLALEILYGPLVQMTSVKRAFYGEMLIEVCKALLELGGYGKQSVEIKWPQILPKNRKEEADTAIALNEVGVSQETVLTELGYDPAAEAEKRDAETERAADLAARTFNRGGLPGPGAGRNPGQGDGDDDGGNQGGA
jgi:hypothetical protein